jgi:predicted enzyme related to lactoylglutathione lyase
MMMVTMRIFAVTIDCSDPLALARFYKGMLGGAISSTNDTFVTLIIEGGPRLDFQRVKDYKRPTWPTTDTPAQMHLDFVVADLNEAERSAAAHGAYPADHQPGASRFRVFIDPEGHPFCLATHVASRVE